MVDAWSGRRHSRPPQSRFEFLSPEGLRSDGRRVGELRRANARLGGFAQADGSAYLEQGNTKVLVTVYGPHDVTLRTQALHDRALINVEYRVAAFAFTERKDRRKGDRRSMETEALIKTVFESAVLGHLYSRSQVRAPRLPVPCAPAVAVPHSLLVLCYRLTSTSR